MALSQRAQQRSAQPTTQPVPLGAALGGWNTRDPIEAMQPTDAIALDNWYPDVAGLLTRKGSAPFVDTLTGLPVYSLMPYQAGSTAQLLAASGGAVYLISSPVPVLIKSGYMSDKWQRTNFNGHLFIANGVDTLQSYDGTALTDSTFTGTTLSEFIDLMTFHNRLFLWKAAEAGFWFGPVNGITGLLVFFDLSMLVPNGGNVVAIVPFSYDGGQGIQTYTVIVLDTGDMLMYQGTDPSNASNWSLVGRYMIGVPLSRRAVALQGGDVYIITDSDYLKLSVIIAALAQGLVPPFSKASGAIQQAALVGSDLFGWDALFYSAGRRIIFNVPEIDGSFSQHVLNTATNAWCRYRGMNALCWAVFNGKPFFGTADGIVCRGDTGSVDITSEVNPPWDISPWDTTAWSIPVASPIAASGQQAWTTLNSVQYKRMSMVRPVLQTIGNSNFKFGVGFDYKNPLVDSASVSTSSGSPWDISPWDTSPWSDTQFTDNDWHISGGIGVALSISVNVLSVQPIAWVRTDFRYEQGTAL